MPLRYLLWIAIALLTLAAGWHVRNTEFVRDLINPGAGKARPIQFDNGSRREIAEPVKPPPGAAKPLPQGVMRKCLRGREVVYTDVACPAGYAQGDVSGGTVNTVAEPGRQAGATGTPASAGGAASAPGKKAALREVLDMNSNNDLRQRMMDRAIDQSTR
ncbi:hypothetical protein [Roseateles sp. PN1]|uniref:hypothetical protein n=1 Tax=Roseateles sp. PN1 TaxID=3137372 RepID=UPI003139F9BE